jgi:hypothetical protein
MSRAGLAGANVHILGRGHQLSADRRRAGPADGDGAGVDAPAHLPAGGGARGVHSLVPGRRGQRSSCRTARLAYAGTLTTSAPPRRRAPAWSSPSVAAPSSLSRGQHSTRTTTSTLTYTAGEVQYRADQQADLQGLSFGSANPEYDRLDDEHRTLPVLEQQAEERDHTDEEPATVDHRHHRATYVGPPHPPTMQQRLRRRTRRRRSTATSAPPLMGRRSSTAMRQLCPVGARS